MISNVMADPVNRKLIEFSPWQIVALNNPFNHFFMIGGVGSGKTFTGAHFAIKNILQNPEVRGFIGANTYDQMTQATLAELMIWFEHYGIDYVIDCQPPKEWGEPKKFKKYANIISCRVRKNGHWVVCYIFTRVLSEGNPLRGIQFGWYWIDESRDTPLNTHDVILSRMRGFGFVKGLVTTTPAGEDWVFTRSKRYGNDCTFGSLHVKTIEAVRYGILTQDYYRTLRRAYSAQMAAQELDALHVNVTSGTAYYSASNYNKLRLAPWGGLDPNRPLIVGCDFNFAPAPCIWMVGQVGMTACGLEGIHWFGEIVGHQESTPDMCIKLLSQYPGFFYKFYGDASGTKGSTSNQGLTDLVHINETMNRYQAQYSCDFDQANPRVKDRVENMNRMFNNSLGEKRQSYNPDRCPNFDSDLRVVGWKKVVGTMNRGGRLDDMGDFNRTHATDGGGYAIFKLFPPIGYVRMGGSIRREHADL